MRPLLQTLSISVFYNIFNKKLLDSMSLVAICPTSTSPIQRTLSCDSWTVWWKSRPVPFLWFLSKNRVLPSFLFSFIPHPNVWRVRCWGSFRNIYPILCMPHFQSTIFTSTGQPRYNEVPRDRTVYFVITWVHTKRNPHIYNEVTGKIQKTSL